MSISLDEVSDIGLGCNNFGMTLDLEQSRTVVDAAVESGVTYFDTADVYGGTLSETYLGQILGPRRRDVVIATKFGVRLGDVPGGLRAPDVVRAAEASLRRLDTDYIDMFMVHYPSSWMVVKDYPDAEVPILETLEALNHLMDKGMVRSIGCSNFSVDELLESSAVADQRGLAGFAAIQNELSLLVRGAEDRMLPECDRTGIAFVPYFPLASGLLTGKYQAGADYPHGSRMAFNAAGMWAGLFSPDNFARVDRLTSFAADHSYSLVEVAFAWLLSHPSVSSVIAGATSAEQVTQNAAAAQARLSVDELAELAVLLD